MLKSILNAPKKSTIQQNLNTEILEDITLRLTVQMPNIKRVTIDLDQNKTILLNHCVKCEWGFHCIECIKKVKEKYVLSPIPIRKINIKLFE